MVSIRYIAVLGSQRHDCDRLAAADGAVSIRYIAVLGSQQWDITSKSTRPLLRFHPLYRGTWFPTFIIYKEGGFSRPVSIRYIAVLGSQHVKKIFFYLSGTRFHPLYRGTWFPTPRAER